MTYYCACNEFVERVTCAVILYEWDTIYSFRPLCILFIQSSNIKHHRNNPHNVLLPVFWTNFLYLGRGQFPLLPPPKPMLESLKHSGSKRIERSLYKIVGLHSLPQSRSRLQIARWRLWSRLSNVRVGRDHSLVHNKAYFPTINRFFPDTLASSSSFILLAAYVSSVVAHHTLLAPFRSCRRRFSSKPSISRCHVSCPYSQLARRRNSFKQSVLQSAQLADGRFRDNTSCPLILLTTGIRLEPVSRIHLKVTRRRCTAGTQADQGRIASFVGFRFVVVGWSSNS